MELPPGLPPQQPPPGYAPQQPRPYQGLPPQGGPPQFAPPFAQQQMGGNRPPMQQLGGLKMLQQAHQTGLSGPTLAVRPEASSGRGALTPPSSSSPRRRRQAGYERCMIEPYD